MTVGQDASGATAAPDCAAADPPVRRVLVFSIIALALLMASVDMTIVATALHALQEGLNTSINWAGWTITAYSFGLMLLLPVTGRLSELYGRRRVFLASIATFTIASLCCGLVDNIYLLIALRAVQAAGGAGITPSATGIVVEHFGASRDRAISLFGSIFPIGAILGPIFGGLFVTYWSWRGVFLVNVPIGVVVIVLALRHIPRDPPRATPVRPHLDGAGMALLGTGLLAGMLAASFLGERGGAAQLAGLAAVAFAVAVLAVALFVRHIRRAEQPFIAPRLIGGRGFGAVNLVNMIYGGATSGAIVLIPLYATSRYGIGTLDSGTLLVAQGIAAIALSIAATFALRRTGHRSPVYLGALVIAGGLVLLALRPAAGFSPYLWLAAGAFVVGAGAGWMNPATRNAGMQLAPEHSGTLAALRTMGRQTGSITTISVATAVLAGSTHPGSVQAVLYLVIAALLMACLPIISRLPEHHGAW